MIVMANMLNGIKLIVLIDEGGPYKLLRSKILQVLKSKTNEPLRIRNAQSVSQCPFKMGKRKPKFMNG